MASRRIAGALIAVLAVTAACGGGSGNQVGTRTASKLLIVSGDTQSGAPGEELSTPLVVRVIDSNGAPVQGQVVNFRVVTGGGSVFAGTAITDGDGMAQERWTLGPAVGLQSVEARAVDSHTGAAIVFATFTATAVSTCAPPDTIVYWTFTDASGGSTTDCAAAGVSTIRIFVNDQAQTDQNGSPDLPCADFRASGGALFPTPVTGSANLQVEAYDANGDLRYLAGPVTVNLGGCGDTVVDANLSAQQGTLTINLTGFTQCPSPGYIWYSLTDVTNPQQPLLYSAVDGLSSPTAVPCSGAIALDNVPMGKYRLDWIQVVAPTANPQVPFTAVWQNCVPTAFTHSANDTTTVNLTAATTACQGS